MPTLEFLDFNNLFCMFKGEPGTRKSTQALSFPKPIYYVNADQKVNALALPMRKWRIDPKLVSADNYKDWTGVKKKLEELQVNCPFRTVVLDSVTSLSDHINRQTLRVKLGITPGKAKDETSGKAIAGIPVNSIEDFNAEDSALKEMIALLKDIHLYHKVNIVIIAHVIQRETKSADGKTHMSRSLLTAGKGIAAKLPAYCDEVYHFNIKTGFDPNAGGQYALWTVHTGDDFARTTLPLTSEIVFGDEPLYDNYLLPAINKLKAPLDLKGGFNV